MQSEFCKFLNSRLKNSLPGLKSQMKMAPKPANEEGRKRETSAPKEAHSSSVLILLFPNNQQGLNLLLTQRTQDIDHGGQLSLPGGRAENGEAADETALRETEEEVGISGKKVKIVGQLSELYVEVSKNKVKPVIGFMPAEPKLTINHKEVEEAFAIPIDTLVNENKLVVEEWHLHGNPYKVPYWKVHRVPLWGATAMILSELADLYSEFLQS